jgi:hypothetical protein
MSVTSLLLDHFLDDADDRPFRRRNQQSIPTCAAAGIFDDDVHVWPREALGRNSWHLPRGRFSNVPQWPDLNVG